VVLLSSSSLDSDSLGGGALGTFAPSTDYEVDWYNKFQLAL